MNIQPKDPTRKQLGAGMIQAIRRAVEIVATRNNCSKSFVISTILADVFGIKEQSRYYDLKRNERKLDKARRNSKVVGIKQGKRRSA